MKTLSLLTFAVLYCLIVSCTTTTLLNATFEADAVGSSPNRTLPGDPTGDEITYVTGMEPRLRVQNSTISESKALHYTLDPITGVARNQKWITFKGTSTDLTQTIWFIFSAQNTNASDDIVVDVSDGANHPIARLTIRPNGDVALTRDLTYTTADVIGNVGSQVHNIVFTTNASTLRYTVSIYPTTGRPTIVENRAMLTTSLTQFVNPARPTISFLNEGVTGTQIYAIGNVGITRRRPANMP